MDTSKASKSTQVKVGLFSVLGLLLIGAATVYVNHKPYWWRSCNHVYINVEDATGLKTKSPIRSLGLEIGYLDSVELSETQVRIGICITAQVEILESTRAYIRGEGFLGDKFVELKPVRYTGKPSRDGSMINHPAEREADPSHQSSSQRSKGFLLEHLWVSDANAGEPSVAASNGSAVAKSKEVQVGRNQQDVDQLIKQVDGLVTEMTSLTKNLKEAIDPQELRKTMIQLNKTLEAAGRTLSPEGNLTSTAQRVLSKLEEAIEHLRDQMARINRGEGSVGKLLNDPSYAEEIRQAIRSVNSLLGKVSAIRIAVVLGAEEIPAYKGGRGYFQIAIWPTADRYYLLGITSDPRGKQTIIDTTTVSGGTSTYVQSTQVDEGGILLTGMLGKVLWHRVDLSAGFLHGDGTASLNLWLGPNGREDMVQLRSDTYSRGKGYALDDRLSLIVRPAPEHSLFGSLYARAGLESIRKINGKAGYEYGAGVTFDDQDIKLLFALR